VIQPGSRPRSANPDPARHPPRPALITVVAGLLVLGGLVGAAQLLVGDFVVTGSLPAKGPILGVAVILYAGSVTLGLLVLGGRGWLAAMNLTILFAIAYLPAFGRPMVVGLGLAHAAAAVILVSGRGWFAAMSAWRAGMRDVREPGQDPGAMIS